MEFAVRINTFIIDDKVKNVSVSKFNKIFDEFDEDQNGYLNKAEMAVLMKKILKKTPKEKVIANVK